MPESPLVAYFSMEIALDDAIPTYSGGLGILAGDTLHTAADMGVAMIGVTLCYHEGYFRQQIDEHGWQHELPARWNVADHCQSLERRVVVQIEGRNVTVGCWRYDLQGPDGHRVPVLMLDTNVPENSPWDRELTSRLYGGDAHYRLCQEVVLGIGGVRMLRALGYLDVARYHMNEGHAAMLGIELLDEHARMHGRQSFNEEDIEAVRRRCVFTTHTPVPAGHDRFDLDHVERVLGRSDLFQNHELFCCDHELNMTYLALNLSHYVNGVAKRHGEVSRAMLKPRDENHHYQIDHITNGVHLPTWTSPSYETLFDQHLPGWRDDNASLRSALAIPPDQLWQAHQHAKTRLIQQIRDQHDAWTPDRLTLGFARRATAYKRPALILSDLERLKSIGQKCGGLQIVMAGKAHPRDDEGKRLIHEIVSTAPSLAPEVQLVYMPDYDRAVARWLIPGVDVWLNTPQPPLEASGTSGMKAAVNGVPSLSVLDGWWIEGCIEGITGWSIGQRVPFDPMQLIHPDSRHDDDAKDLYDKLESVVIPMYFEHRDEWIRVMSHAIALNASHFNTQRMLQQYIVKAYFE